MKNDEIRFAKSRDKNREILEESRGFYMAETKK